MLISSKKTVTRRAVLSDIIEGAVDPAKPGRVGCGGEEEESPRGDDDQHGGDVVQEDVPLPPIKDEASA